MKKLLLLLFPIVLFAACNTDKYEHEPGMPTPDAKDGGPESDYGDYDEPSGAGEPSSQGNGQTQAGVVTAGEWRDLDNWLFWSNLMTNTQADQNGSDYTSYSGYWGLYTNNRVAVSVKNESGEPQTDVPVRLVRLSDSGNTTLYEARTDNKGEVNLWVGLTQETQNVDTTTLALIVNGTQQGQPVSLTRWGEEVKWNNFTTSAPATSNIDIAFIVDATGSMYDEIDFLKADLAHIISTVKSSHSTAGIRTAAVFYRDEGDDYVTRKSNFSDDISVTTYFISNQSADGGGDYPEAVHTAMQAGLQKLSWRKEKSIRLAFMLLDAPPHKQDDVIASLQNTIPQYAKAGIRVIPVAASGVDKPTEFFLRFTAIATDGTYVFITNDSGVGNDHITPTVGDYKVELLNELIVRIIDQYLQ